MKNILLMLHVNKILVFLISADRELVQLVLQNQKKGEVAQQD